MKSDALPPSPVRTLIHKPVSVIDRIEIAPLFAGALPLQVELGSGDGSFLARYAALRRDRNFIGVERLLGRLRKLDRKGLRAGLDNLRLIRFEAAYLVEYLLPARSVEAFHIYFPDPWPKRKHRKNRLINEHFTKVARAALAPGGIVFLRTDDSDYFAQMTEVFGANKDFAPVETPEELAAITTDFERQFNQRGIPTLRAAYRSV